MNQNLKNQEEGFLKTIILVIIALFILKYYGITISDAISWVRNLFESVFQ